MDEIDATALRSKPRVKLFQPTELHLGTETVRAHLLDLSATGALVHTAEPPAPGATIRLRIGDMTRAARVMWADGRRLGIDFRVPLTDAEVDAAAAARSDWIAQASAKLAANAG